MKIIVIARTRNEQRNIGLFCRLYDWADKVLIADGGSVDRTIEVAKRFQNVEVREFDKRVVKPEGKMWRNPHGEHINFLIRWAESERADWIIFDDVDCFPNIFLQKDGRNLLSSIPEQLSMVRANRIYLFGTDKYFRKLTLPNKTWERSTSLYAWRAHHGIYADESDPWSHHFDGITDDRCYDILPPYCLLHDYYPDGEERKRKVKFYRDSLEQENARDPLELTQDIDNLEEWMKYE